MPLASVLAVCHRGGRGRRFKLITMKLVPVVPVADLEEYEKAPNPDSISDRME